MLALGPGKGRLFLSIHYLTLLLFRPIHANEAFTRLWRSHELTLIRKKNIRKLFELSNQTNLQRRDYPWFRRTQTQMTNLAIDAKRQWLKSIQLARKNYDEISAKQYQSMRGERCTMERWLHRLSNDGI